MNGGADAVAPEAASGHSHPGHVLLRQLVGIGVYPRLETVRPCGHTANLYLVAEEVEDKKTHQRYAQQQEQSTPPQPAIDSTEEEHDVAGKEDEYARGEVGRRDKHADYQDGDEQATECARLFKAVATQGDTTGQIDDQRYLCQLGGLETDYVRDDQPALGSHDDDHDKCGNREIE